MNDYNIGMKEDIFLWWHKRKLIYPRLYRLAIKYLIIPATSTESERVFSTAGLILDDRRNRLTDDHLNMLIFLAKNTKNN